MLRLARPDLIRTRWLVAGVVAALGSLAVASPASAATTPATPRVDLRVLVVTAGDAATTALESAMDDDGVPYTEVDLRATGRPTLDAAYLEDAAAHHGRFQAVVLPNQAGSVSPVSLTAAELTALAGYEKTYGVRQVNGYDFPTTAMGATSAASGTVDGTTAAVTAAGLGGPFSYLRGPVAIENIDPAVSETYGYLATAATGLPAGASFTPLVSVTVQAVNAVGASASSAASAAVHPR